MFVPVFQGFGEDAVKKPVGAAVDDEEGEEQVLPDLSDEEDDIRKEGMGYVGESVRESYTSIFAKCSGSTK